MNKGLILFDVRESNLINEFKKINIHDSKIPLEIKQLDIGDIHILFNNDLKFIIERKTMDDLNSSIIDKRLYEQKNRIKNQFTNLKSSFKVIYIIENFYKSNNFGISYDSLLSSMMSLIVKDNFFVLRSQNICETAYIIKLIYSKIESQGGCNTDFQNYYVLQNSKKSLQNSKENIWKSQLCCIPGISSNIANNIYNTFNSYESLYLEYIKNNRNIFFLTNIPKIGKKLSSNIENYLFIN